MEVIALILAAALAAFFAWNNLEALSARSGRTLAAAAITVAFALFAWYARGVTWSGACAGAAMAFILAARDFRMFCILLTVFAVTLAATRLGTGRKQQLHAAEPADGRSASQVMANLGLAGLITTLAPTGWPILVLAALAEAAADTSSSEIGMAFPGKTVLITNWKPVAPGVDGGISLRGTTTALVASGLLALAGKLGGLVTGRQTAVIIYAGFLGTLVDSLLGAVLERRGWLTNDLVNFLSTATAVAIARVLL